MPRASIDYMNARRANKAASGGSKWRNKKWALRYQDDAPQYDPKAEQDPADAALCLISSFSLWAETSRQIALARLGMAVETETEIPF